MKLRGRYESRMQKTRGEREGRAGGGGRGRGRGGEGPPGKKEVPVIMLFMSSQDCYNPEKPLNSFISF